MLGVLAANNLGFGLALAETCQTFWPVTVPQEHGVSKISLTEHSQHCNITHWTQMEEMKWFISAMLCVLGANNLGFGLALAEICQTFRPVTVPQEHCVSKISLTEPSQHCNITHWTQMEEMKWFSSVILGLLGANNLGFGLALAEICQTFSPVTVP